MYVRLIIYKVGPKNHKWNLKIFFWDTFGYFSYLPPFLSFFFLIFYYFLYILLKIIIKC